MRIANRSALGLCLAFLCGATYAYALPKQLTVSSGQVHVEAEGSVMNIHASDRAIIHYQEFGIAPNERVRFIQPDSKSVVLNRVFSETPSLIEGMLDANGRVFLVNPRGVFFGKDSRVDVGALVVSTLDLGHTDMQSGVLQLHNGEGAAGDIVNEGVITASEGVFLIAPNIYHEGVIRCPSGHVAMLSADQVFVRFNPDDPISFSMRGVASNQLKGGSARELEEQIIQEVINLDTIEEANALWREGDHIILGRRATGVVRVSGQIDVSSSQGLGGGVQLSASTIDLVGARVDASGESGGGRVDVGGEYRGEGKLAHALTVSMDESSQIFADAGRRGDGGQVVLWSDQVTSFNGKIFARGGSLSGNGGLIETSSHGQLGAITAKVDTSAPLGKMGAWLLDPTDLVIQSGGGSPYASVNCSAAPSVGTFFIDASAINSVAGGVCLAASNSIFVNQDITMTVPGSGITFQPDTAAPLTGINTIVNNSIRTNNGPILFSGSDNSIVIGCSVTLDSGGADITFHGTVDSCSDDALTIDAGAGKVTFNQAVGSLQPLETLIVTATDTVLHADVIVNGNGIEFHSPVHIAADLAITNYGFPTLLFGDVVGSVGGAHALKVNSVYSGVAFSKNVSGLSALIVNSKAPIIFDTGVSALTISGPLAFNGPVESHTTGLMITADSIELFHGMKTLAGAITSLGPVILAGDVLIDTTAGGVFPGGANVTFSGAVSTINGRHRLGLSTGSVGAVVLEGEVGGSDPLNSLTVRAALTTLSADVTTIGNTINFTSPLALAANAVITDYGNEGVFFADTVNGAYTLDVNAPLGSVEFAAAVGGVTPLSSLTIAADKIRVSSNVTTSGVGMTFNAPVTFPQTSVLTAPAGTVTFNGMLGSGDLTVSASQVNFLSPVAKIGGLTVTAGGVSIAPTSPILADRLIQFSVTGALALNANLTAQSGKIQISQSGGGSAVTVGSQMNAHHADISFAGPVTLTGDVLLNSTFGSGISFLNSITAAPARDISFSVGIGDVTFGGAVTGINNLWIYQAKQVNVNNSLVASAFIQEAGFGKTVLGDVTVTGPLGLRVTSQLIDIPGKIIAPNGDVILNSLYDSIGFDSSSPFPFAFSIVAGKDLFVGAYPSAYFKGSVAGRICPVKANPPCAVFLNGSQVDFAATCPCNRQPPANLVFTPIIPSRYFVAPGMTSHDSTSHPDRLSAHWYFDEPEWNDNWFIPFNYIYSY